MATSNNARELITGFAKDNPTVEAIKFINEDPEGVEITLIEGGVVNYIYRVRSRDHSSSVILKYAEEYIRLMPDEKISLDRQTLEYNALVLMHGIQPGCVPEPYCLDTKYNILAMKDLSDWEIMGKQMQPPRRHVNLEVATQLGHLLSKVNRKTTQDSVSAEVWQEYQIKFKQVEQKQFLSDFRYERSLNEKDPSIKVLPGYIDAYRGYVADIRSRALEKKIIKLLERDTCFIHMDMHINSIFIKGNDAALCDFEFAFLSHPAGSLYELLCCYVMLSVIDAEVTTDPDANPSVSLYRSHCLQACQNLLDAYLEEDIAGGGDDFFSDLLLLTGGVIWFLTLLTSIDTIIFLTDQSRGTLIKVAHRFMMNHENINNLQDFMKELSM